jgi:predicted nucleotidyltransferase
VVDEAVVSRVVDRIVRTFRPRRVILFGSHARGEARPDSDLDLFIEMETPRRPPDRAIEIRQIFGLHAWPMDIVVYTPQEVEQLRRVRGTLVNTVEAEGKVLYERG